MKVLIIEDERIPAQSLKIALGGNGQRIYSQTGKRITRFLPEKRPAAAMYRLTKNAEKKPRIDPAELLFC